MGQERITPQRQLAHAVPFWRRPEEARRNGYKHAAECLRSNADDPLPLLERKLYGWPDFDKQGHRPKSEMLVTSCECPQIAGQCAYLPHENAGNRLYAEAIAFV